MAKPTASLQEPSGPRAAPPQVAGVQPLPFVTLQGGEEPEAEASLDLTRYLEGVRKRWWLLVVLAVVGTVVASAWSLRQPEQYRAVSIVSIETATPQVLTGVADVVPVSSGGYWGNQNFYEREYLVLQSRDVARLAAAKLGLPAPSEGGDPADAVRGRFSLEPDRKATGVVRLVVIDGDPEQAAAVANAVAEAYVENNLEKRIEGTREASTWLSFQHGDLKRKLEESEDALYRFMEDNDVLNASLESQLAEVMQRLNAFNGQLAGVQAERIKGRLDREALREAQESPALLDSLEGIQGAGVVSTLKSKLIELRAQVTELSARYQAAHPRLLTLNEQIELVKQELEREIDAVVLSLQRREASLEETERGLKQAIAEERQREARLNKLSLDFKRLQREVETNERLYEMVTGRMKEADLTGALRFNNISVLERARVPGGPFSPKHERNIPIGLVAGLLLGLLLAIGFELLDNTVKNQGDLESAAGVPFLGLLPIIEVEAKGKPTPESMRERDLYVLRNPKSSPAECARFIRTNLLFMGTDRPFQTLVITSPGPQEGKTTTSISLAVTMAQAGSRTLLIDADMRRPRLHRAFGVSNEKGLSNLIVGDAELDEVIQRSEAPGLDVLVCGPTPPNPSELLHTRRFAELVEELTGRYDRILFDAPPVGAVTDPVILGAQADGVLLVVKCQKTTRQAAEQTVRALQDANARIVGAVLNDVDLHNRRYGSSYYQYYRRYGGYYGEDEASSKA